MEALFNAVCDTLPANIWSPTSGALRAASTRLLSWRDDSLVGLAALAREYTGCVAHEAVVSCAGVQVRRLDPQIA